MWTFVWFLIGLLTGLAFAFPSPALQQRLAPLTNQGVTDDRKTYSAVYNKAETPSAATTSGTVQQPQPPSNPLTDNKSLGKETVSATAAQQGQHQRVVVESDPLHASDLITTPTKKLSKPITDRAGLGDNGRSGKNSRGSLRRRGGPGAAGSSLLSSSASKGERRAHDTALSSGTPNHQHTTLSTTPMMPTTTTPGGFPSRISTTSATPRNQVSSRTRLLSATATVTAPNPETPTTATVGMDSIPMDAESRWRDHHMKRQWAQSLLMESMEPVLSRHLRYAIKSVLHFTNAGPEIMDLKGSTSGLGHWDSFASPMVFPPKIIPHALSNSIQINHQASTPITATPTQASHQQLPAVSSSHATRTDHIRIPNTQQRTRSASINSLSQLLEAQRVGEAHRSKDLSTSSITQASDLATSVPLIHRTRSGSTTSSTSPTIVVRGFTSTAASAHTRTVTAEEAKSKSTMMVEADDISEIERGLGESQLQYSNGPSLLGAATIATVATIPTTAIDSTDNLPATLQTPSHHESEPHRAGGVQNRTHTSNSSGTNTDGSNGGNGFDIPTDQDLLPSKPRHSRLWSKMRKVVYGESKQHDSHSRNTIYLATGGSTASASRSMSDIHLSSPSSKPLSTSATSSFNNIAMPSFSSSVLSVLNENPMSPQKKLPKTPVSSTGMSQQPPKVSVAAFQTPPETAPNSPTQTLTPTSPTTRSRFGFSHNLPGLARRSSTKSPVAAAELTTAESRVSQFMYATSQTPSRPESTTSSTRSRVHSVSSSGGVSVSNATTGDQGQGMPLMDLTLHNDLFSTPNALERSNFKSALKSSADVADVDLISQQFSSNAQIGRSKSTSSAQRRETKYHTKSPAQEMATGSSQQECFADGEQFSTAHRRFREFGILSPPRESLLKDSIPLDMTRRRDDEPGVVPSSPPPSIAWNGNARHISSSPHQQQTSALSPDGRPLSPSQMLSGSSDPLLEQSKQDRRKSAISFGGYFSNPSVTANRRTRDLTGHSISGLETDAQGEIIHLRRTSFFDKVSPPTLTSLATMLHSNLPSLSQSLGGTDSPSLSRSPSKSSGLAQEQRPLLQGRPSPVKGSATAAVGEADNSKQTATSSSTTPRDLKKRIAPLKITPLLLSGVSSLPSPMFPPLSATIPRPLGSSTFAFAPLDRYFFNVDQVHEWNIPSFGRVKFTDHAPLVFHAIRERFHYTLADMDEALSQPMTVMKTPGKSDAIFFASHNHGRFLLKTLRGAEPDNLKGFLSDYLGHIQKHPNTLLPRYLGMYTFEKLTGSKLATGPTAVGATSATDGPGLGAAGMGYGGGDRDGSGLGGITTGGAASRNKSDATAAQHLHLNGTLLSGRDDGLPSKLVVVVLANVFDTPEVVHERYDFKGSNVGRRTLPVPVDGVALRESRSLNPIVPELQPRASMDKDSGWSDFAHRHSHWRTHQLATPTTGESRASSMYYEPRSDNTFPHLHSGELGAGSGIKMAAGEVDGGSAAAKDISHLTLKEVDFQNRVFTGETQLIHLGSTRKAEVLAQLEEDTSLLRKHGFMDYSMLVGIRILPKQPVQEEEEEEPQIFSSQESSRRGSLSSRGSDADNSNLDSDMEEGEGQGGSSIYDPLNGNSFNKKSEPRQNEIEEALSRIWKFFTLSAEERLEVLKGLGEKAQGALKDVYSFGEVIVSGGQSGGSSSPTASISAASASATSRSATKSVSRKDSKTGKNRAPPEVELKAVKSDRSKHHHHSRKHKDRELQQKDKEKPRRPLFEDDDENDNIDLDSFQTVRYKPRAD
ncbi:Phosphatidylinositol 5-phosphate 4-kinase type-2 alpha, partial [Linnemannia exigua]